MLTLRTVWLTALALTVVSPSSAQINVNRRSTQINITNINHPQYPFPGNIGTVAGYRPRPPAYRPPIGVVGRPLPSLRPVPPVVSLRPTIYPAAYFKLFPAGYRTILVRNVAYHYYPVLPPGATFVTVGGAGYYRAGGMWFQPYATGDQNLFLAVPPPL